MTDKEIFKAELDRLKEETSIGLSEWENGVEHGRMEIINALYKTLDSMQEEPVSEELDSFAIKYAQDKPYPVTVCQAVKVGANWQKQQMMAKAVDGEVGYWNLRGLSINTDLPHSVSEGDKVKIIVIEEE